MKVNKKANHTIPDTLNEIERLVNCYYNDLLAFKNYSVSEFFYFVANDIEYQKDPVNIELLMRPEFILKRKKADCDEKTILCLSFFKLKNIPCGYSIVSNNVNKPFHHIFPFLIIKGKRYDFDCTYAGKIHGNNKKWIKRKDFIFIGGK